MSFCNPPTGEQERIPHGRHSFSGSQPDPQFAEERQQVPLSTPFWSYASSSVIDADTNSLMPD